METRIGFMLGRRNFIKLTGAVGMGLMALRGIVTAAEPATFSGPSALAPPEGNTDLTLPNGAKVDLTAHCPGMWNDSWRRPRGRGHLLLPK